MKTAGEGKAILDSDPERVKLIRRRRFCRGFARMNANMQNHFELIKGRQPAVDYRLSLF